MILRCCLFVSLLLAGSVAVFAQGSPSGTGSFPGPSGTMAAEAVPEDINWDDRFGPAGTDGEIKAIAVGGDDIYVGGNFRRTGGIWTPSIGRWNTRARKWYGVGSDSDAVNGTISALALLGGKLYVAGQFDGIGRVKAHNLAIYDLATGIWSAWGDGTGGGRSDGYVTSLLVVGSDIYVGGEFTAIGTILANNIARWDGKRFYKLGGGLNAAVSAMTYAEGTLYVGGDFITAGVSVAGHVAGWDGASWRTFGGGTNGPVRALAVDQGYMYAGGTFDSAGGSPARNVARYELAAGRWTKLGGGVRQIDPTIPTVVNAIQPVPGAVYIGGDFRLAEEIDTVRHVAYWDGEKMHGLRKAPDTKYCYGLGKGASSVNAMALIGGELYLAGSFKRAYDQVLWFYNKWYGNDPAVGDSATVFNIVRWNLAEKAWHPVGPAPDAQIRAIVINGDNVYFSGDFHSFGGVTASKVARWNSRTSVWTDLGAGLDGVPTNMAVDAGKVYAATVREVFVLNKESDSWQMVGDTFPPGTGGIVSFTVSGSTIWAGSYRGLLRQESGGWELIDTVGLHLTNIPPGKSEIPYIGTILVDGGKLYAGGLFTNIGNVQCRNIAVMDIATGRWSAMEEGLGYGYDDEIHSLAIENGQLVVGGKFVFSPAGQIYNHIAEWDGVSERWMGLGAGMNDPVFSLAVGDGILYAGGEFVQAGEIGASHVAMWDGEVWSMLGSGTDGDVSDLAAGNNQVIVAGSFEHAGGKPSYQSGRWSDQSLSVPVDAATTLHRPAVEIAPNPSSAMVTVRFASTSSGMVRLTIFNAMGSAVATPVEGELAAGEHTIRFDVSRLAAGLYYCKLQQGEQVSAQPIVVAR